MKEIDYVKIVFGVISGISAFIGPFILRWLIKNFKEIKESKELNKKLKKDFDDSLIEQKNNDNKFKNELEKKINDFNSSISKKIDDEINSINKDIDRKIGVHNYELDRNRKGVDTLFNKLISSAEKFDEKVKESNERMKSELMSKESYYKETSQFKDEFLRELFKIRNNLQSYEQKPTTMTEMFGGMDSLARMAEKMVKMNGVMMEYNDKVDQSLINIKGLDNLMNFYKTSHLNEKKINQDRHQHTKRMISSGLKERRKLEIKVNNAAEEARDYQARTEHKLTNYNKVLEGLKKMKR